MRHVLLALVAAGCAAHPGATRDAGGATRIGDDGAGHYTATLDSAVVMPGEERYLCQDFANPFGGAAAAIGAFESHLTPGAHHLLVFYRPGAVDGALADCAAGEFAAGPYGSQRADDALAFPPGVAAVIAPGDGLRVQLHYLNASASPVTVEARVVLTRVDDASVRDRAAVLFFSNLSIDVPAGANGVVAQKSCTLPFAATLIEATGHMHRHGRRFVATVGNQTLVDSSAWSDVAPTPFTPPLALPSGSVVTFGCTYDNGNGRAPIVYGNSARDDEMCIFTAQFYPAPFGGWSCF